MGPLLAPQRRPDLSTAFTADAAAALPGPPWLRARRSEAAERFTATPLPSPVDEVWRYSRVTDIDLDAYALPSDGAATVPDAVRVRVEAAGPRAGLVVAVDGRVVAAELDDDVAAQGVFLGRLAEAEGAEDALGAVPGSPADAFSELHDAFAAEPVLLRVPAGVAVARPVVVVHWAASDGVATFPHLVVQAGPDSEVVVLDEQASADVSALIVPLVELDAGPAARLRYVNVQTLGRQVTQVGRQASRVDRDAYLLTAMVAFGGDYARLRVDSSMTGQGGSGDMLAAYFGDGTQMHDFRTLQDHVAPRTTSDLLFKGALDDEARAVYTGLIRIEKQASGVNAFQTNRNLKLSDGAWAESVPNLEIMNNDVRCSHAGAVGPVDEEQLFYLESRGVPPDVAERLVVLGFFDDVLERLPVAPAVARLHGEVAAKLDRREGG